MSLKNKNNKEISWTKTRTRGEQREIYKKPFDNWRGELTTFHTHKIQLNKDESEATEALQEICQLLQNYIQFQSTFPNPRYGEKIIFLFQINLFCGPFLTCNQVSPRLF